MSAEVDECMIDADDTSGFGQLYSSPHNLLRCSSRISVRHVKRSLRSIDEEDEEDEADDQRQTAKRSRTDQEAADSTVALSSAPTDTETATVSRLRRCPNFSVCKGKGHRTNDRYASHRVRENCPHLDV